MTIVITDSIRTVSIIAITAKLLKPLLKKKSKKLVGYIWLRHKGWR